MTDSMPMLQAMYGHSMWANRRLLDQAEHLTPEQLHAEVTGTEHSIHGILLHQYQGQFGWLRRFQALPPVEPAKPEDFPDVPALRTAWEELDRQTVEYIAGLTPADLNEVITYRSWAGWEGTGPRWEILLHQAFHQHQHRGEVALTLTNLGRSPGEIDVLDYLEETDQVELTGWEKG